MGRTKKGSCGTKVPLAYGSTGLLAAVTLLMVLSPAIAAVVHSSTTLTAPYKGTVASPHSDVSISGCASARITSPSKWSPTSGVVTTANTGKATTCAKTLGSVGSYGSAYADSGISVAIPLRVASNGNHGIQLSWSIAIASVVSSTTGGCPATKVVYPPPANSSEYAYCEAETSLSLYFSAQVQDLNNASWGSNYSSVDAYNVSNWGNTTDCYNYGTPKCVNFTGSHNGANTYGYNEKGRVAFSGSSTLTMWTNGTNMLRSHHYVLMISVSVYSDVFTNQYNLVSHWPATASASLNMATLGNGAKLSSVTIA